MNRKSAVIGAVVIVVGSVLMLSLAWGLQHAALSNPPVLGKLAPRLAIQTAAGAEIRVWELEGHPVVLNFWASWCGPCVQEGSVLADASSNNPQVAFVGADNRDTNAAFQAFEQNHPHPYPAGPIVNGSYQSYGVAGLPATFFLDTRGIVVASFTGPLDSGTLNHYMRLIAA